MVAYMARLCDVLLSTRNKRVEAVDTRRVNVPAIGTPDNEAVRLTLDVSTDGSKELDALIRQAKAKTVEAWAPVLALGATRDKHSRRPKKAKGDEPEQPALADTDTAAGDPGGDEDAASAA